MKSIIARFTELKENVAGTDASAFDDLDYNKVDTALKSVGVSLVDTNGQFRDLDDVFLDLSAKWQSLDRNSQRYIATIAAGSRQQSRFISMMQNYERTMELIEVANDSAGKSSEQFAKYQDTIEYKLKQLSNSWEQLRVGFFSSDTYGKAIEGLTGILNKIQEFDAIDFVALGSVWILFGKTIIENMATGIQNGSKTLQKTFSKVFENVTKRITNFFIRSPLNIDGRLIDHDDIENEMERLKRRIEQNDINIDVETSQALNEFRALEEEYDRIRREIQSQDINLSVDQVNEQAFNQLTQGRNDEEIERLRRGQEASNSLRERDEAMRELDAMREMATTAEERGQNIGNALMAGITVSITNIITQDNPLTAALSTGIEMAITSLPIALAPALAAFTAQISSGFAAAGSAAGAAFTAAGGPVILILSIIVAAIAGAIVWVRKAIKESKIDKLQVEIEKTQKRLEELQKQTQELSDLADETEENIKNAEQLKKDFDELKNKTVLTTEEQERYNSTVEQIRETFPSIVTYYDEITGELRVQNELWDSILEKEKQLRQETLEDEVTIGIATNETEANLSKLENEKELRDAAKTYFGILGDETGGDADFSSILKRQISHINNQNSERIARYGLEPDSNVVLPTYSSLSKEGKKATLEYAQQNFKESNFTEEDLENSQATFQYVFNKMAEDFMAYEIELSSNMKESNEKIDRLLEESNKLRIQEYLNKTKDYEDVTLIEIASSMATNNVKRNDFDLNIEDDGDLVKEYESMIKEYDFMKDMSKEDYNNFTDNEILDMIEDELYSKKVVETAENFADSLKEQGFSFVDFSEQISNASISEIEKLKEEYLALSDDPDYIAAIISLFTPYQNSLEEARKKLFQNTNNYNIYKDWSEQELELFSSAIEKLPEGLRAEYTKKMEGLFANLNLSDKDRNYLLSLDLSTLDLTNRDSFIEQIVENTKLSEEQAKEYLNLNKDFSGGWIPTTLGALEEMNLKLRESNEEVRKMGGDLKSAAQEMTELGSISLDTANKLREMGMEDSIVITTDGYDLDIEKMYSSYYNSLAERRNNLEGQYTIAMEDLGKDNEKTQSIREELIKADMDYVLSITESIENANEAVEEAEKAVEDTKKAYDDAIEKLADLEKAYWDAVEAQQEALYGSEDFQSSLDGLINYTSKIEELSRAIEKTKEALEDVNDIGQATNLVSQLDSDYQNKSVALGAENRAIDDALANLQSVMLSNYSDFISFDENGLATVDFSYVDMNVNDELRKAFEEEYNTYEEYRKKKQENIDEIEAIEKERNEFYKQSLDDFVGVQEDLISILKDQAQEEIDVQKDKYAALEEADNNYIEALEEAINKQRELRDKESKYEDLATKEKKLSLMSRDTSEANQKEVQSLEKEIENDRQEVLDSEIDNIINSMKELYEKQKEARDAEIEYMEEVSENTQNFAEWANNIMSTWTSLEDMQGWYLENNPEVENMTPEQVEAYMNELEENYTTYAQYMALKAIDFTTDQEALNNAINDMYLHTETNISDIGSTIQSTAQDAANAAIEEANRAVADAKKAWDEGKQDALDAYEEWKTKEQELEDARTNSINMTKAAIDSLVETAKDGTVAAAQTSISALLKLGVSREDLISQYRIDEALIAATERGEIYSEDTYLHGYRLEDQGGHIIEDGFPSREAAYARKDKLINSVPGGSGADEYYKAFKIVKYKQGGLVDYTGPAWVDGTKTNPEAFLSAQDTERIGMAARILSDLPIFNSTKSSENAVASNIGDTSIEIHINVENIASDYDVDQMIERVKKDIVDVSKPIGTSVILRK